MGVGICIKLFCNRDGSCGTGASCCMSSQTMNVAICLPNQCLLPDCTPEP